MFPNRNVILHYLYWKIDFIQVLIHKGVNVAISYLDEYEDAEKTLRMIEEEGAKGILIPGDVSEKKHCQYVVDQTLREFGKLDIVVNKAAQQ